MSKAPINLSVTRVMQAPADHVYDLVADITRMGDWSPETTEAKWIGGASGPVVGARFSGANQAGPNKWTTKPTVTVADRGREFAFKVPNGFGPTWTYSFEAVEGGTLVTESVAQQKRSPLFIRLLQKRAGITDRAADLHENMTTTLANIAHAAETASVTA